MRSLQQLRPSPAPAPATIPANPTVAGIFGSFSTFDVKNTLLYVGVSICVLVLGTVMLSMGVFFCMRPRNRRRAAAAELQRQRDAALQEVKAETEAFKPQIRPFPVLVVQPGTGEVVFAASDDSLYRSQMTLDKLEKASTMSSILSTDLSSSWYQSSASQGMPASSSHASLASLGGFTPRESAESDVLRGETSPPPPPPLLESVHEHAEGPIEGAEAADAGSVHSSQPYPRASDQELVFYNPMTHFLTDRRPRLFTANVEFKEPSE